jgi:sodium/proline symporter
MTRAQAILATLVAYKLALLAIGLYARRRTHDGLDFFLGGRRLGPAVAALSAAASSSSAWTLLGVSGAAYAWGLSSLWIFPACVGGFALNWFVLARPLRRLSRQRGAVTVTELLAGSPSSPLHRSIVWSASLITLFSLTVYVASQFQGAGKTFGETFGLGVTESVLLGSGIVVLYTLLGGFWAVSLTDSLQGLVMAASALFLPLVALARVGGPAGLVEGLGRVPDESFLSLTGGLPAVAGLGFVLGVLGIGLGYPGQPHVVNRFMALEEGEAPLRRGRMVAMVWAVAVYAGMILLGLCGRVLFPALTDEEVLLVAGANELLPPVVAGVMIAAVLSAIMSTADSQLLVAASSVSHDLVPHRAEGSSSLLRSRLVVVLLSLAAIGAALVGSQHIFSRVLFAWSALGNAFGPLLLVTALRGPVPPRRTLAALLLGFTLSVAAFSLPATAGGPAERVLPFLVGLAICLYPTPHTPNTRLT